MRSTVKNLYWIDISILLLALIVMLLGIGSYSLYEPHEGHFAMVGREMTWRNDWITPHLNGSPYLNKPPLLYWAIALSTKIWGYTEFAARFPVAMAGWLGIVVAWKWTRELWGISSSRVCALMLSVTLGWFIFTHQILIDVLLATLLLTSNYFLWRSLARPHSRVNWWGLYVSLALCVLTKGAIGIVFPLLGCLALMVLRRDWKIIERIDLYRGLLLILALILPWAIAIERANPGFWHYFIINEHLDRLLDRRFPPDYEVSTVSALGYLGIFACWCLPWILFLPSVVKFGWQQWQRGSSNRASASDRHYSDGIFLLAMATILPVVSFLPFSSRLIYYSIPAVPSYVMLCAGWWSYNLSLPFRQGVTANYFKLSRTTNWYGAIAIILGIFCFSLTAVPGVVAFLPVFLQTSEVAQLIVLVAIALGIGWLAAGMGMLKRSRWTLLPLIIALIITYSTIVRGFILYQDIRSSKNLVLQTDACLSADTLWTFEGSRELGAAGAIGYYLNQDRTANKVGRTIGWATTEDTAYRTVLVLANGGKNRLPPRFPGSPPPYIIDSSQLQIYWDSDRPVAFLTDFLRQPNDSNDPITLNLPQGATQPYKAIGQRQLYLNQAAQKLVNQKCSKL